MAQAFNKYNSFVEQLALAAHNLSTCTLNVGLSNTVGDAAASQTVFTAITQIGAGTGYTTGGATATRAYSYATGTVTVKGTKIVWTGSGGGMGPFQYCVLYNDFHATKGLIGWWAAAAAVTLAASETFSLKFNSSDTSDTMFTLS